MRLSSSFLFIELVSLLGVWENSFVLTAQAADAVETKAPVVNAAEEKVASAESVKKEKEGETDNTVPDLKAADFEKFLQDNELVLVMFYAPWCGHCKALEPHYKAAAQQLQQANSTVKLVRVDAQTERELATAHGVQGFPTLFFFRNGKKQPYTGGRTTESILEWIKKMTGPAYISEKSHKSAASTIEALVKEGTICFKGVFKDEKSPAAEKFKNVADVNRMFGTYVLVVDPEAKESDIVVAHRKDTDETKTSIVSEEELTAWLELESLPLFGPVNGQNYGRYAATKREWIWFAGEHDAFSKHQPHLSVVAKKYKSLYNVVYLDLESFKGHAEHRLGMTSFPAIVIQTASGKYQYDKPEITEKLVIEFIEDVKSGKVQKSYKSEEVPKENNEPVKTVVGKTFEELVFQKDKDVFLMIHATWCGHCKKAAKPFSDAAEFLIKEKVDSVVLAKFEGTLNEIPVEGFDFRGFPTFYYVKAGAKPISYEGDRETPDFLKFIKENSTQPVSFTVPGGAEEPAGEKKEEL